MRSATPRFVFVIGISAIASRSLDAQTAAQQPATAIISGRVRNAVSGSPIPIAVVRVAGGSASTLTNDGGRFRLELPLGPQRLEVRRIGFRPASIEIVVQSSDTVPDIRMEPVAVTLDRVLITAQ